MARKAKKVMLAVFGVLALYFLGFVLATTPSWKAGSASVNYTTAEDSVYFYNFSQNITGYSGDVNFTIDTDQDITWTNSSGTYNVAKAIVNSWIRITDADTGNLTINATRDNQTGFFVIPVQATNTTDDAFSGDDFEFIINATNDYPTFTQVQNNYTLLQSQSFLRYVNATDEEEHYPLYFNISFFGNCTHAEWSGRNAGENCSILNFTSLSDTVSYLNMTPSRNDVGTYWANVSVMDAGENYNCPHIYCDNATYEQNKTTLYSSVVLFNVLSSLEVNVSNCTDKIFQEGQSDWCLINITTKGETDSLNISTYSILRNYAAGQSDVQNTSWFYADSAYNAANFVKTLNITINATKEEIGNWTINFSVFDWTYDQNVTEQIHVYVNRTSNDVPDLVSINNVTTSVDLETVIDLSVYDDDLLIPDKAESYGGYNETIDFALTVLNLTTMTPEDINGFDVDILQMPVSGTNKTTAEIRFTPNSTDPGQYFINVSVEDKDGTVDYETFNLTVLNNRFPYWIEPLNTTFVIYEDNNTYLNLSMNATDDDGDSLTFSYSSDTAFEHFSLNPSTGVINFTPTDSDVGQHLVNISISDGYLSNSTVFNFTVLNINDEPMVKYMATVNASPTTNIYNESHINVTEDNLTTLMLWVEDDDLRIPTVQKDFYDENFSLNVTIEGVNTSLFSFVIDAGWWPQPDSAPTNSTKNRTRYNAIFTPKKVDLGDYNVTINLTDLNNASYVFFFNMTISEVEHGPALSNFSNFSTAVNRSWYYDMNVTDTEDGNDTSGTLNNNFTFSYSVLNGSDIFASYFNSTTGIFNMTFNDSQEGVYRLNITVNDSSGLEDTGDFWIYVYGPPNVSSPGEGYVFNLTENVSSILNFTVNHSIGDNLTYEFYIDSVSYDGSSFSYGGLVLRNSTDYFGDGTQYNWSFTPNTTDESYGRLKNLTLVVYPSTNDLANASRVNTSINYKLNVSHANSPVVFYDNIDDKGPTAYTSTIAIDLKNHFSDQDYTDSFYNEVVSFTLHSNNSAITSSISSAWILTLSSTSAAVGEMYVFADDGESNITSNNFTVTFSSPSGQNEGSSGSSSTREVPVSLKVLMPDPVSVFQEDHIELPLTLYNDGDLLLSGISLNGSVAKNGVLTNDVNISFSKSEFDRLYPGNKENVTMYIDVKTEQNGTFEITVNASVRTPDLEDWGKMFISVKEGESVLEKLVFTEEFIVENPECLELKEVVDEAKELADLGRSAEALKKADQAVIACRELISQASRGKEKEVQEDPLYRYLIIAAVVLFLAGIGFYAYKRMMLKKKRGSFLQENIKNRKYLEF